jgi:pimeloyl-ACP methyl ester carboxylesterase
MKEHVAEIGRAGSGTLVGIETPAAAERARIGRPAVVWLNAGVVPHVGPHRVTVKLTRRLAEAGFHSFRFDLAGLGESEPRISEATESPNVRDCREVMDHLEQTAGVRDFVLGGLCSGADNSLRTAVADPRVVGIVLLDAYAYRTPGFYLRKLTRRGADVEAWTRLVKRASASLLERARSQVASMADPQVAVRNEARRLYVRRFPPKRQFGQDLKGIVDRGGKVYIIYTGNSSEHYNDAGQFQEGFRAHGLSTRVRCEYWPEVNHTFTELAMQERLVGAVVAWAQEHWEQ